MSDGIRIELTCCESVILNELGHAEITQKDVAMTYAMALCSSWPTDWKAVNEAITKRWPKGLDRVKTMAWRIVEQKRKEARQRVAASN